MTATSTGDLIADHGLLSNCQGSALVTRDGTINWACLPRFDAPAMFTGLLSEGAGHWSMRPTNPDALVERHYLDPTMVLATTWQDAGGHVEIWDLLPLGPNERGHRIGRNAVPSILRIVHGRRGSMRLETELDIRPEFGLIRPRLQARDGGLVAHGGATAFAVSAPIAWQLGATATACFDVQEGDCLAFEVRLFDPWGATPPFDEQGALAERAADTVEAWRSWSRLHQNYQGAYRDQVAHSGRILQALTYAPTGAIVAAPTTSLPEAPGGALNWDYRYSWVRDASLTLEALWVAACPDEAEGFFDFFATAAGTGPLDAAPLPIMYGVGGERHLPEVTLDHLDGFAGSRPVRVGNGAWNQLQLDVYGELLGAAWRMAEVMGGFGPDTADLLIALADAAAARWHQPDQGIWEVRGGPRHFTYSKLMCWVALDRAIRLAGGLGAAHRVDAWTATRAEIRRAIEERCWNPQVGAYTQSFESDRLDASVLMMLIVGFLELEDPRARATVEAVAEHLTDDHGFVYRYRPEDAESAGEGTFLLCTFWLAHCWALLDEPARARSLFDAVIGHANDLGLFSEELDASTGAMLGNFPQAFTHVGVINAAWAIDQAERPPVGGAGSPGVSTR